HHPSPARRSSDLAELLDALLDHPAGLATINRHRTEPAQEAPVRPLEGAVLHHDVGVETDLDHRGAGKYAIPVGGMRPANHHRLGHIREGIGQPPTEQLQESLAKSARKSITALRILHLCCVGHTSALSDRSPDDKAICCGTH